MSFLKSKKVEAVLIFIFFQCSLIHFSMTIGYIKPIAILVWILGTIMLCKCYKALVKK